MKSEGVKERPILFNGSMLRAILDGRKTQTRRVVKCQPCEGGIERSSIDGLYTCLKDHVTMSLFACPLGQPGDLLWVRETCFPVHRWKDAPLFAAVEPDWMYRADYDYRDQKHSVIGCHKWTPSIHMPREASRILLRVKSVRVERLQDISEADAQAEGLVVPESSSDTTGLSDGAIELAIERDEVRHIAAFQSLWEAINGYDSWDANPWVWVVEFEEVEVKR